MYDIPLSDTIFIAEYFLTKVIYKRTYFTIHTILVKHIIRLHKLLLFDIYNYFLLYLLQFVYVF